VAEALIKAGKRFDMMILPGQNHGFGDMTDYFFWMMADYFSEHLIGDRQDTVDIPQLKE
jgi:dipeptidyl aminopeptidase/acylaminoacyl peptidase